MGLVLIALHRSLGFPGMVPKTLLSTFLNIRLPTPTIVFRRWQDRVTYYETRYLTILSKRGSRLTSAVVDGAVSM
jgi:hypothetical protein